MERSGREKVTSKLTSLPLSYPCFFMVSFSITNAHVSVCSSWKRRDLRELQRRCAAYQLIPGVGQLVRWKNGKCSREMQNKVKGGRVTDAPGLPPPPYQPGCLTSSLLSGLSGLIAATRRNKARDSGNLNWRQRRHSSDRVWAVVTPASLPLFLQLWPPTWTWRCSLCFSHTHSECLISRGKNTNMVLDRVLRRSTSHD